MYQKVLYPPYVLPCSPGLMHNMISLSANTADTGYTGSGTFDRWKLATTRAITHCHRRALFRAK